MKSYLKDTPNTVIQIEELDPKKSPLIFLDAYTFQSKIYYATKEQSDGSIEVTPYFFVPPAMTPPCYQFVLDVSGSMQHSLGDLKTSVITLAGALFAFAPQATISITTFSNGIQALGTYATLDALTKVVNKIEIRGDTPLYNATLLLIEAFSSSKHHNNVLLFTDGENNVDKATSEEKLKSELARLSPSSPAVANNKLFVISYNQSQAEIMERAAELFNAKVIPTSSLDFIQALSDKDQLQSWAAACGLFTGRIVVSNKLGAKETIYAKSLDMSGQLVSLDSKICMPGDTLEITLVDSRNITIAQSKKTLTPKPATASPMAHLLGRIGLMPTGSTTTTDENAPTYRACTIL